MTQESVITDEMRAAVGVESEVYVNDVEKGAIIKFAQAIGDDNPIYTDEEAARQSRYGGLVAPPTFFRSLRSGEMKVDVKSPYSANLDGGSEWEYYEPVRPGDRIAVSTKISDMYERQGRLGNMLIVQRETKYVNQFGTTVAIQRTTGISYQPSE
ncbi:MAG: MaoC family dehydratase N-terminal domain-containing protein [Dehalococcoidia bacterium]|nr:MaoC family dehydratase N-terminal domain-containing protein [Dehalococcoidia bacterium]